MKMRTFGKFTVNTSAVQKNIVRAMAQHRQKAVRTMTDVGHFLRGEIQDRTPVKEGFLTAEILFAVRENQQSLTTAMYVPSNAQSKDYAIFMHESFYLLGPGSLEKQRKVNVGYKAAAADAVTGSGKITVIWKIRKRNAIIIPAVQQFSGWHFPAMKNILYIKISVKPHTHYRLFLQTLTQEIQF